MKIKLSIFFGCFICIILTFILTNQYLSINFYANGEAFSKGYGHLLQENLSKGIFYVSMLNLILTVFLTIIFLNFFNRNNISVALKILLIIMVIIIILFFSYIFFEWNNIINGYIAKERIIEISLMWISRLIGIFTGYFIAKKVVLNYTY